MGNLSWDDISYSWVRQTNPLAPLGTPCCTEDADCGAAIDLAGYCEGGRCVNTPVDLALCDDGDPCTIDSCTVQTGYVNTPMDCPGFNASCVEGMPKRLRGSSATPAPPG